MRRAAISSRSRSPTARSGRRCADAASPARSTGSAPCARMKSPTSGTWSLESAVLLAGTEASSDFQLGLLTAEEADVRGEDPGVPTVGDDDLDLTVVVPGLPADHAELQQGLLDLAGQPIAAGRVRDLNGVTRQQRGRPVALEERLEERPLDRGRPLPDELGHELRGATRTDHLAEDAGAQRRQVLDVQLVQGAARGDHPLADVPGATDGQVVGGDDAKEVVPVHVVEARAGRRDPALRHERTGQHGRLDVLQHR